MRVCSRTQPGCRRRACRLAAWGGWLALVLAGGGCNLFSPASGAPADEVRAGDRPDTAFTTPPGSGTPTTPRPQRIDYQLAILRVLIPHDASSAAKKVWSLLREDALDADTQWRLRENGIRVGVGHEKWWDAIKAALEGVDGYKVTSPPPLRAPPGFSISIELDEQAREQTLFYLAPDGNLSGATWPGSRNVLRVTYVPDARDVRDVRLFVVPEVQRPEQDWQWVRGEGGLTRRPRRPQRAFESVAFAVTLRPGEFVLVAPSENARVYGLLGGAFLTRVSDGRLYDAYLFLRPQAQQAERHE